MHRNDGGIVDAELLRPCSWIARHKIEAGKLLPMSIEELQVYGSAMVTSIDRCPEIANGEGSVVTARFITREVNTIARVVVARLSESYASDPAPAITPYTPAELRYLATLGLVELETIEGTPIHPIWSVDRRDWVPLGELTEGERLQAADSSALVVSVTIDNHLVPVYNIEVHGEHVYEVGELGVLVHNAYPNAPIEGLVNVSTLKGRQLASEFSSNAIKRLKRDMKANGFDPAHPIEVVIVDGKKIIWDGHHRARAAGAAGIKEVPIKILEKSPEVMREMFNQAAQAAQQFGLPF